MVELNYGRDCMGAVGGMWDGEQEWIADFDGYSLRKICPRVRSILKGIPSGKGIS